MRIVFGKVLLKKKGEKIMTKRFGFTLAEVLITLGIIGVVAAMTMPTLMNQTNGAQYKAAYKKALSAISQGVTLNVALDGGSFADIDKDSATDDTTAVNSVVGVLRSRMNVVDVKGTSPYATSGSGENVESTVLGKYGVIADADTFIYFNDGSMFGFKKGAKNCSIDENAHADGTRCEGFIDVNGLKGPNKVVTCKTATETAKDAIAGEGADAKWTEATACEVSNPTDIYPVFFYDQTILPATNAAKAVLYGK